MHRIFFTKLTLWEVFDVCVCWCCYFFYVSYFYYWHCFVVFAFYDYSCYFYPFVVKEFVCTFVVA